MPGAAQLFRQAFECLPEDGPLLRGIVIWLMGSFYFEEDAEAASRIITEAVEFSRATGNLLVAVGVIYSLGWQQMMRGHLRQAEKTFSQGSQLARADPGWGSGERDEQASPISVFGYQGLGDLLRERNELEDAARYLIRAVELGRRWGNPEVLADGYIALARVRQAQGDAGEAVSLIREAARFVEENRVMLHTALQVTAH